MPVEEKMESFQAVMRTLHQYGIMPDRSPMLVFVDGYKENNRMHLLALRQICKMCLDMVEARFVSLDATDQPIGFNEVHRNALEDEFEEFVLMCTYTELEMLYTRLIKCVEKLNQLILHS